MSLLISRLNILSWSTTIRFIDIAICNYKVIDDWKALKVDTCCSGLCHDKLSIYNLPLSDVELHLRFTLPIIGTDRYGSCLEWCILIRNEVLKYLPVISHVYCSRLRFFSKHFSVTGNLILKPSPYKLLHRLMLSIFMNEFSLALWYDSSLWREILSGYFFFTTHIPFRVELLA
jgi:hypothetical protein